MSYFSRQFGFFIFLTFCPLVWWAQGCKQDAPQKTVKEQPNQTVSTTQEGGAATAPSTVAKRTILFFGNSLTAGYGLSPEQSFTQLLQNRIDSLHLPYHCVNAGLSGETTADGKNRIDWVLKQKVDVFVLELGGNDALRGKPVAEAKKNLQAIIDAVRTKYPDCKIVLAGMQAPPNLGNTYTKAFKQMYASLATENKLYLVPFLLDGVGGVPRLNQADGIHPTAEGQYILADNIWKVLRGTMSLE